MISTEKDGSRQAAIDELDKGAWGVEWDKTLAKTMIESLPSAQPEIIWCKDCKYRGVGDYCVYGTRLAWVTKSNDFCSKAERRTDED